MTLNAFMTDDSSLEIVSKLCRAIQKQEVMKDHPEWWVLLLLDGFRSNVNVLESHNVFQYIKLWSSKKRVTHQMLTKHVISK